RRGKRRRAFLMPLNGGRPASARLSASKERLMAKILIVLGHPDGAERHLCHALADAYAEGAQDGGHSVSLLELARMDIPFLTSQKEQEEGVVGPAISEAQDLIRAADHIVF